MLTEPSTVRKESKYKSLTQEAHKFLDELEMQLSPVLTPSAPQKDGQGYGGDLLRDIGLIVERLRDLNERVAL